MTISDICSTSWDDREPMTHLVPFLRSQGVDLCAIEAPASLERGTPVYVSVEADPIEVQRRMVQAHVRMLFVLDGDSVAGIIDISELVRRAEDIGWEADISGSTAGATA